LSRAPIADVLGPVLRWLVLAAAMSGLRQSELIGRRWRDVDFAAQRIRVRNTYVGGEHSGEGKSDRSTSRCSPGREGVRRRYDTTTRGRAGQTRRREVRAREPIRCRTRRVDSVTGVSATQLAPGRRRRHEP
jgi:integrase